MKLARIVCDSPDSQIAWLAVVQSTFHRVIDLDAAERLRLDVNPKLLREISV